MMPVDDGDEDGDGTIVLDDPTVELEEDPLAALVGTQTERDEIVLTEDDVPKSTRPRPKPRPPQGGSCPPPQQREQHMAGEMFFCEGEASRGNAEEDGFCIAMDAKLAIELSKMFGKPTGRDLVPGDFVVTLKRDLAREIHKAWLESISRRKDEAQTRMREDEELAKQVWLY